MWLIDYPALRRQVTLQQVLDLTGCRWLRHTGLGDYGMCPLSCCSHPRVCSFDLRRGLWCCHKCRRGGNQLDLYAALVSLDLYTGAKRLCEQLGIPVPWLE